MSDSKLVLIIDDEPDLTTLLSAAVESRGHRTLTASNGLEGLEVLKTQRPDLIVLDMNMPKMGGVEFYNELSRRSGKGRPEPRVLVLTARTGLEQLFRDLDVDGFMTKPFDNDEFLDEVDAILGRKASGRAPVPGEGGKTGAAAASAASGARAPRRVLVIENSDKSFAAIVTQFAAAGFTVMAEKTGAAGIERAKREAPDLVLSKIPLPDLPGDLVARRIRTYASTSAIPVILYTSRFSGTDRTVLDQICEKSGASRAVESDDASELLQECERVLGG